MSHYYCVLWNSLRRLILAFLFFVVEDVLEFAVAETGVAPARHAARMFRVVESVDFLARRGGLSICGGSVHSGAVALLEQALGGVGEEALVVSGRMTRA